MAIMAVADSGVNRTKLAQTRPRSVRATHSSSSGSRRTAMSSCRWSTPPRTQHAKPSQASRAPNLCPTTSSSPISRSESWSQSQRSSAMSFPRATSTQRRCLSSTPISLLKCSSLASGRLQTSSLTTLLLWVRSSMLVLCIL